MCVGGVVSRGEALGAGAARAWPGCGGWGWEVAGCRFGRRGCVGSACNHSLGGAGPCRVGRKVGLGGAELEKGWSWARPLTL